MQKSTKAQTRRTENIEVKDLSPVKPEDRIPLKEKVIYGAADLFGGGQATMIALLLLIFYTDVIGIAPAVASSIIMISKIWDAVSDPLCGVMSDNLRTKFGRRKPFMLVGGILIIPATAMLFAPIQSFGAAGKAAFAAVAYLIYCTVSTISQVPFMSMSSDISSDYRERNKANTIKLVFDMAAAGLCYLIPSILFEMLQDGKVSFTVFYLVIVVGFGLLFSVPLVMASFMVKERVPYPAEKTKFSMKAWLKSFRVKSFKYHIYMYIGAYLCMDIISALALYYCTHIMRGQTLFGMEFTSMFIIAPMMVTAAIAIAFLYMVMQKRSKQFTFRLGFPLYILGGIIIAVYQTTWPAWIVLIGAVCIGVGLGGGQMMPWLIFPDTIDAAELKLGYRPTGNFSGVMTFSRKMATAFAIWLVGIVLSAVGYIEGTTGEYIAQPESVHLAIRWIMGASIVILISWAGYASFRYKINNKKLIRARHFNDLAREGRLNELTDEEKIERILLKHEIT